MFSWKDYAMKQEQYRDQLREAQKQRLVRPVTAGCQDSTIRHTISNLVSGLRAGQAAKREVPCPESAGLAGKAAC